MVALRRASGDVCLVIRAAAFLTVLLGASHALAEEPAIAPSTGSVPTATSADTDAADADAADADADATTPAAEAATPIRFSPRRCSVACRYEQWLSYLMVTRDIELPGETFALRLLPTRRALAGASSNRIVLRANAYRSNYIGLDVTARF